MEEMEMIERLNKGFALIPWHSSRVCCILLFSFCNSTSLFTAPWCKSFWFPHWKTSFPMNEVVRGMSGMSIIKLFDSSVNKCQHVGTFWFLIFWNTWRGFRIIQGKSLQESANSTQFFPFPRLLWPRYFHLCLNCLCQCPLIGFYFCL